MIYATTAEILEALEHFPDLNLSVEEVELLIDRAERAVDQRLGPYAVDPITGRKLDPEALTPSQLDGLRRAVAVAVGHLSQLDPEATFGLDDFAPAEMRPMAGAGLGPRIDAELADLDLIRRGGTALPDPLDELSA
jgi:hypothetical protein